MTDLGSEKSRALISGSVTDFCCSGSHCPVFKILDRNMSESMCLTLVASFTEILTNSRVTRRGSPVERGWKARSLEEAGKEWTVDLCREGSWGQNLITTIRSILERIEQEGG